MKGSIKRETIKHRQAFAQFVSMGAGRSLAKLGTASGISEGTLESWSSSFEWQRRAAEADAKAGAKLEAAVIDEISEIKKANVKIARGVQSLFGRRMQAAVGPDGKLRKGEYKPSMLDVKLAAELAIDKDVKAGGDGVTININFVPFNVNVNAQNDQHPA